MLHSSKQKSVELMKKQSFGTMVAQLRKEQGMTQLDLAEKMGVTDKAVSKWERDLSFPDVNSLPKLAEIFCVSVDELMQNKVASQNDIQVKKLNKMVTLILRAVAMAMGIAVAVLCFQAQFQGNQMELNEIGGMLGIGLACLAISLLSQGEE
jgi:transcriptional regulator with XRE-family HTH domain